MRFCVGDVVEVTSKTKGGWTRAVVCEAAEYDCLIDGYRIPCGGIKVQYSSASKWIMPEDLDKLVRPAPLDAVAGPDNGGKRKSARSSDIANFGHHGRMASAERRFSSNGLQRLCKEGCGFPVQPGLTRTLQPFNTCCKKCALTEGQGGHDLNCAGADPEASRAPPANIYTGPNPKLWIEELLKDPSKLQVHCESVYFKALKTSADDAALTDKEAWVAIQDNLLDKINEKLHVGPQERDDILSKTSLRKSPQLGRKIVPCGSNPDLFESPGEVEIGIDNFIDWCRMLLTRRMDYWFPPKLCLTTANFVMKNPMRLEQVYHIGKKMGEGSFGVVHSVIHRISNETRVCKRIAKMKGREGMKVEEIMTEIGNMAQLDHPGLIKVYEYFEDDESISQIMEPCKGGELQDRIDAVFRKKTESCYTEAFMCDVLKQLMRALAFMHSRRYMHKDLKPQNIMLVEKMRPGAESADIKVIDFGLAELFKSDQQTTDQVGGTLLYMAPEVFKPIPALSPKSDIWSAGVILFNLICGDYPFMADWPLPPGKTLEWWQSEVRRKIEDQEEKMKPKSQFVNGAVSTECVDVLRMMLQKDDRKRPDAAGCLDMDWYRTHEVTPPPLSVGLTQCLEAYAAQADLKKALFLLIAHQSTAPALGELRSIFTHFDNLNTGSLKMGCLRDVLLRSAMNPLQVERVLVSLDRDSSDEIRWTEFIAAALCISVSHNRNLQNAAFAIFDGDGDGKITDQDLMAVLAKDPAFKPSWKDQLPNECQRMAPDRPRGPFTFEHVNKYMEGYMHTSAGNALRAVS